MAVRGTTVDPHISTWPADEKADHLGIVFVHGVGFQDRGETLRAWADRLIRMLSSCYASPDAVPPDLVYRSEIDLDGAGQSSIMLRIPGDKATNQAPQHWRVTEAYWAASFQPPSVPTMLAWLGARGAAALAARGFALTKRLRNSVYLTGVVIAVLVLYAAIRVVASILPFAAVRNTVVAPLDRLITGWSGDMHVLLFDPAQSANVRTRVIEAMQALVPAGFERVAVIAHSGGAVASYMTLTDDALWPTPEDPNAKREPVPAVPCYITLGQGLNIAWRLCDVGDGGRCDRATGSGRRLISDVRTTQPDLRWYDYYSEGDTVAEAAVSPPECLVTAGPDENHSVENKPANPHGTYWDNDEEFLLPVVRRLISAAQVGDPASSPEPTATSSPMSSRWVRGRLLRVGIFSLTSRVLFSAMVSAIVASVLFGGGRLDDIGSVVVTVASEVPGNEIVTGPIGLLRDLSRAELLQPVRMFGTVLLIGLLLLAALYPVFRLLPPKLAWRTARPGPASWFVRVADVIAAALPLAAVAAWLYVTATAPDRAYAPGDALLGGTIVLGVLGLLIAYRTFRPSEPESPESTEPPAANPLSGLVTMGILIALGVFLTSAIVAVAADTSFGGTSLGLVTIGTIVVWLVFKLLSGIANWRWDAWDEQEREQFRQAKGGDIEATRRRTWGRPVDLFVALLIGAAAFLLAAAIGGPFLSERAALAAGIAAGVLVVLIGLVGAAQDATNSRGGLKTQDLAPLPTAA